MAIFEPRHRWSRWPSLESPNHERRPDELNREAAGRWALSLAFCFCFASLGPGHLFPFSFAGLLLLAAVASTALAALKGDEPLAPHLTAWDEAAWSLTLSLGLRMFLGPPPAA